MPFPLARRSTGHRTSTDDDGVYTLEGLGPANNYVVVVTHPDYATGRQPGIVLVENDTQRVPDVVLGEGAKVTGVVRSQTGGVIAGASVELWNQMASSFKPIDEREPVQVATTDGTDAAGFANAKRREVVMQEELLVVFFQHVVDELFVALGAERGNHERLRLTAGEQCRAVSAG